MFTSTQRMMGCSHPPIDPICDDIELPKNNPYRHAIGVRIDKHCVSISFVLLSSCNHVKVNIVTYMWYFEKN